MANEEQLTTSDFNESEVTLQDFENTEVQGATLNEKTSATQAATTLLLTDGSPSDYPSKVQEVSNPASRAAILAEHTRIRDALWQDAKKSIENILADDTVDDQTKLNIFNNSTSQNALMTKPTNEILAEQAALGTVGNSSTDRSEESVDLVFSKINEVVEFKRQSQALMNGVRAGRDPSTLSMIKDVGEVMVPFAEWIHFNRLEKELSGTGENENKLRLLGNQKQSVFSSLEGMTIQERAEVVDFVMNIVEGSDQVLLPDGNDLVTLDALQQMFLDNDYSNFERWFDNVVGVLEVVGIGSLLKQAKRVAKPRRAFKEAEFVDAEMVPEGEEFGRASSATEGPIEGEIIEGEFTEIIDDEARMISQSVRTDVDPSSPSQIVKEINPEQSRAMHETMKGAESDDGAKALYGTNKDEAMANDLLPVSSTDPEVPHKTEMNAPRNAEPEHVRQIRLSEGNTLLSDVEWGKVETQLMKRFQDVEGMHLHSNSLSLRTRDDGLISIMARYSPVDSGFRSASEALESAKYAFRNYGLSDGDFKLLVRDEVKGKWTEESLKDAQARETLLKAGADPSKIKKEYAIGLDYEYRFRPEDQTIDELLTTSNGIISRAIQFADRAPSQFLARLGQGSLVQSLVDPASVIHPRIVNAASVAVDKTFRLRHLYTELFANFTEAYKKAPKDRRSMMGEYIHKANFEAIPFSKQDLYARGFSTEEIDVLQEWRMANDAMWYASNDDLVISLRSKGYKAFEHPDSKTNNLIARPISSQTVKGLPRNEKVFDPVQNSNVQMDDDLLSDLGEQGTIMELKEPILIDGEWVNYVVSRETPNGGYSRVLADDEIVLSYREGYYPVMYDANYFVEKVVKTPGGQTKVKVVATAKSSKELEHFKQQVMSTEGLTEAEYNTFYRSRKDKRTSSERNRILDEGSFSVSSNSNLGMQRVRGEQLADAGVDLHLRGNSNLKDPLEAVAQQIQQMSRRVGVRKYLQTAKTRWIRSYEEFVDLPVDKAQNNTWPTSVAQVKAKPGAPESMVQRARTDYNYLYSMENGYINGIDEAYRATLQWSAEQLGKMGGPEFAEKVLFELGKGSPTTTAKAAAFRIFISSNPARQALIQRGQMSQMLAYNPSYVMTDMLRDTMYIQLAHRGVKTNKAAVELMEEVKSLGIMQAVDAHTLIRDDMLHLADLTAKQKLVSAAKKPLDILQQVGFDLAEQDVLISAYLTFRDLAIKSGKNMKNVRVREQVLGQARAATLNMNRSGDMAYSHNTLGPITQFLSFQHKMAVQVLTNRNLSGKERIKLLGINTALFGIEATPLYLAFDAIWGSSEPNVAKDSIRDGLIDITLNETLSMLSGEDVNIDFSDLAPIQSYGTGNVLIAMAETPLADMIANSPSGSLLFGGNARIQQAFKTGMRYFVPWTDYKEEGLETTFTDVLKASAHVYSGYSAAFKANYAFETGKVMTSSGKVSDSDVNSIESLALIFGLPTKDMKAQWNIYAESSRGSSRFFSDDDVDMWYSDLKRHLNRRGDTNPDELAITKAILAEGWRVFGQDRPKTMDRISSLIRRDAQAGDFTVYKNLYRNMGLITDKEWWRILNKLPNSDQRKQAADLKNQQEESLRNFVESMEDK